MPPKSLVILYFPSEKAPAPPKPFIILQGLQFIQDLILTPSIGHLRFSKTFPVSIINILMFLFNFNNSYAEKIPPGPAPIIAISYISMLLVYIFYKLSFSTT